MYSIVHVLNWPCDKVSAYSTPRVIKWACDKLGNVVKWSRDKVSVWSSGGESEKSDYGASLWKPTGGFALRFCTSVAWSTSTFASLRNRGWRRESLNFASATTSTCSLGAGCPRPMPFATSKRVSKVVGRLSRTRPFCEENQKKAGLLVQRLNPQRLH